MMYHECENEEYDHMLSDEIYVDEKIMTLRVGVYESEEGDRYIPINYCPFCGKSHKQIWEGE